MSFHAGSRFAKLGGLLAAALSIAAFGSGAKAAIINPNCLAMLTAQQDEFRSDPFATALYNFGGASLHGDSLIAYDLPAYLSEAEKNRLSKALTASLKSQLAVFHGQVAYANFASYERIYDYQLCQSLNGYEQPLQTVGRWTTGAAGDGIEVLQAVFGKGNNKPVQIKIEKIEGGTLVGEKHGAYWANRSNYDHKVHITPIAGRNLVTVDYSYRTLESGTKGFPITWGERQTGRLTLQRPLDLGLRLYERPVYQDGEDSFETEFGDGKEINSLNYRGPLRKGPKDIVLDEAANAATVFSTVECRPARNGVSGVQFRDKLCEAADIEGGEQITIGYTLDWNKQAGGETNLALCWAEVTAIFYDKDGGTLYGQKPTGELVNGVAPKRCAPRAKAPKTLANWN